MEVRLDLETPAGQPSLSILTSNTPLCISNMLTQMSHPNEGYYATSAPPSDMSTGMVIGNSNGQISHFNEGLYEPPANDNADNRRNFPAQDGEQQQSGLRHFLTTREGIHRVCSESAFLFSIMSFVGAMSDQPGLLIAFHWRYTRLSYAGIVFHLYEGVQYVLLSTDGADEVDDRSLTLSLSHSHSRSPLSLTLSLAHLQNACQGV